MLCGITDASHAEHRSSLRSARLHAGAGVATRAGATAAGLGFLWILARAIDAAFSDGATPSDLAHELTWLAVALLVRAACMWTSVTWTGHAGDSVQHVLRDLGARAAIDPSPRRPTTHEPASEMDVGETTAVLLDGVADIRSWIVDYLPVAAVAVVGPAMALLVVALLDPLTTLILVFAGPMLLLLLAVIGRRTSELTRRRGDELGWLRSFYLDLLAGLPTLKLFDAGDDGAALVQSTSRRFADTTMEVLRTAFQTSLVMEWASTAATALVAVEVAFRMTSGDLDFTTALAVLMIAPEFFVPLRHLAMAYHSGSSGDAAAQVLGRLLDGHEPATLQPQASDTEPNEPNEPIGPGPVPVEPPDSDGMRLELRDVTFSYPGEGRAAINGMDLIIEAGETIALCGPSGAGKSTVLALLLGFVRPDRGSILANGAPVNCAASSGRELVSTERWRRLTSWVPQDPSVFHGTVAQNIALGDPQASHERIRRAARSAGATEFIEALPEGFDTLLGEGGHTLSGGQRQRIAIARAHLRTAPVVLLDEFTSHVDPQTEAEILDATQQLLKERTVIVIAHRRSTALRADRIVFLHGGSVIDSGAPTEVLDRHRGWDPLDGAMPPDGPAPFRSAPPSGSHTVGGPRGGTRSAGHPGVVPRMRSARRLLHTLHGHRGWVVATAVLSATTIASGIGLTAMAAWLISRAAQLDSTATLALGITAVRLFAVTRVALRYAERLVGHIGTFRWITELRVRLFNALEPLAPLKDLEVRRGDLLARVLVDIDTVGDFPLRVVVPFTAAAAVLVGSTALLSTFSMPAAAVTGTALVLTGVVRPLLIRAATRTPAVDSAAVRGQLEGELVESLEARTELIAWGRQDRLGEAVRSASSRLRSIQRSSTRVHANADATGIVFTGAATMGTFVFAVAAVGDGRLAGVLLAGVPLITLATFEAVTSLPNAAEDASRASAAMTRLDAITRGAWSDTITKRSHADVALTHDDSTVEPPAAGATPPRAGGGPTSAVELRGVDFAYGPAVPGLSAPLVLGGLDLEIEAGSTALISGPSGAGKSTIVDLLCGLAQPRSGTVRLMGQEVSGMNRSRICGLVTAVRQDDHLFDTTVRDNLALARADATDQEMLEALRSVDPTQFVADLPGGLGYRIGPNGENLSGGERQRLIIARALLRDAPVLVLDEATTHLDGDSEAAVIDGILRWKAVRSSSGVPRTVVFIAHHQPATLVADITYEIQPPRGPNTSR